MSRQRDQWAMSRALLVPEQIAQWLTPLSCRYCAVLASIDHNGSHTFTVHVQELKRFSASKQYNVNTVLLYCFWISYSNSIYSKQQRAYTVCSSAHVENAREWACAPGAAASSGTHGDCVECAGHEAGRVQSGCDRARVQRGARRGAVEHQCVVADQPVQGGRSAPTQLHPRRSCDCWGQRLGRARSCTRSIQFKLTGLRTSHLDININLKQINQAQN